MMDERYGKVGTPEREDVMEEIKIYHSLWRMLLMGIGGLAFAVMIILILRSLRPGNVIIGYAGIVFFGLGGLALIFWALKEGNDIAADPLQKGFMRSHPLLNPALTGRGRGGVCNVSNVLCCHSFAATSLQPTLR